MSAIDKLLNSRDVIISVVAENYTKNDDELKRARIRGKADMPDGLLTLLPTEHGEWLYWYDEGENVIYL